MDIDLYRPFYGICAQSGGRADSLLDLHMFKMCNGLIAQIQSVIGPAANPTGWTEQEGAGAGRGGRAGGPGCGGFGRGGAGFGRGGPAPGQ